ncbi:hypothetical protein H6P81_001747 [Aristolochia fimbriata]|uniref:Trichome birefringence-like N-terminal domain-containing protein n=1 Tax=Aristolochia fimbriata TaxID=158543 RepID=A0AAV7F9F4_ARIFI|nr:hypothetical protein H6P81_001747 [Aristolochia fimbriata]
MVEMVSSFSRSHSGHHGRRNPALNSPRVPLPRKSWISRYFNVIVIVWIVISVLFVMGCGYLYVFPSFGDSAGHRYEISEFVGSFEQCDILDGQWIRDETYPLYNSTDCPFAERGFNCLRNGRPDNDYQKWRWKPRHCEIPRFNAREILERLRGKRVVFVGDSMSRTQWESLICLLMTGVEDKRTVYEVNHNRITKQIRFLGTRFSSFNFTIEFFRSVFLVQEGRPPKHGPRRVRSVLKLDVLDNLNRRWIDSDILIFNSGQWWNPGKLFNAGLYFQVNGTLRLGMPIATGLRIALTTWASWVETMIDTNRTHVFFRTFEPSHWSNPDLRSCKVTRYPLLEPRGHNRSEVSDMISEIIANMKVPVTLLHVTAMSSYRSDGHVGEWSDTPSPDCSHWCLPGVPDAWNELMFSYLLT